MGLRDFIHVRKFFAELLGTFVLVVVAKGAGLSLAYSSSHENLSGGQGMLAGSLSGGLGVMMGILITGNASGGHINPAVSVAMTAGGRLSIKQLPSYLLGQVLGAALGSITVVGIYLDTLEDVSATNLASSPGLGKNLLSLMLDQTIGTLLLLLVILSVTEQDHCPGGLLVGLSVAGIGLSLGRNAGIAMNPAVDGIPRLIGFLWSGGSTEVGNFWLIPTLIPFPAGLLAVLVYRFIIGMKASDEVSGKCMKEDQNSMIDIRL